MSLEVIEAIRRRDGRLALLRWLDLAMLVANALGVLLYLWRAHDAWFIPEERAAGINTVTGEPLIWALGVFPVWAAFFLADAAWVAITVAENLPRRLVLFALVSAFWVVGVIIDFAHH
jgi:hypothetical protein